MMSNITPERPLEPQRRAIIVGGSSGIGAALARKLVAEGYVTAVLARREVKLKELCQSINVEATAPAQAIPYVHNVTDFQEIPGLFQAIVRDLGGLDLILYIAGVQPIVTANEYNFEKDARMIKINVLGAIAWLNEAAVRFERANGGHIVGISSIAGDRGRVGSPVYNTSKAALSTYLEALRNRLSRHHVTVTTVKPGFVDTTLLENAAKTFWVISPDEAANQIYQAITRQRQTVYVPARWGFISLVIQHMPSFIFRRLNI